MRRVGWVACVLMLPLALSAWLLVASFWAGIWGAANVALYVREQSLPALARAVDAGARSAGFASIAARGWGALAPVVPALGPVATAGEALRAASAAGRELAPALPRALGSEGPRRYLICGLNDAELFGSGGAPLTAVLVEVEGGDPRIEVSGSVSAELNPGNTAYRWDVEGGPPWYVAGADYPFANSNFHPDFGISGRNMRTAWGGLGFPAADGVITVDVSAVAEVLRAIGPVESAAYGLVTGDDVVRTLLVDAYRQYPEDVPGANERRQALNAQLQGELIDRLREPRTALRAALALWRTIPGRHLQGSMADPAVQRSIQALGADGSLSAEPGDVLGVFAQSGPSKLAIFQERAIRHEVVVLPDGSAQVTQTTTFTSAVPEDLTGDPESYRGRLALLYRQRVAFRLPENAQSPTIDTPAGDGIIRGRRTGPYSDGVGGWVMWQGQDLPPGGLSTTVVTYSLPPGFFGGAGDLEYRLWADPQATVAPTGLEVVVTFPAGWAPKAADPSVRVAGSTATWVVDLDRPRSLRLGAGDAR